MTNFERIKEGMEFNGYAYFDRDAFLNDATKVCYIPENAEDIGDCFTYLDLKAIVESWAKENPEYMKEHSTTVDAVLLNMFETIEWTFPYTFLEELN